MPTVFCDKWMKIGLNINRDCVRRILSLIWNKDFTLLYNSTRMTQQECYIDLDQLILGANMYL